MRLPNLTLKSFSLIIIFFISILLSCGKNKEPEPELPPAAVETSELAILSPISAKLTGKLLNQGTQDVLDHGFVYWFGAEGDISSGVKVSLGPTNASGFYVATLNDLKFPLIDGVQGLLVMKAYVTDKTGTYYGNIFSASYKKRLAHRISHQEGKTGDIITIDGLFTGLKASDIKILFGNIEAPVRTIADTTVTVEVPIGIPVGHGQTVEVKAQAGVITVDLSTAFRIWANIKDFNPKSGPIGTKISFIGDNLPLSKDIMSVDFGTDYIFAYTYFDKEFYVRIPANIQSTKLKLHYLKGNRERIELPSEFTVTPPKINSITPNPALAQQTITIHMENTEPFMVGNEPLVHVGNFSTYILPNDNGDLVFKLGGDLVVGKNYPVTVTYGPHTVTSPSTLSLTTPVATSFSPKKGFPGTELHIFGKFAKGATPFVNLGDRITLFANAISDTELVTYIPMGVEDQAYSLSIEEASGDVKLPGVFEAQSTRFDKLTPASGPAGTSITITGEGFFDQQSNGYSANLGGPVAHSTERSLTRIVLLVPTFTTPGTYKIKLQHINVVYETGLTFTVTN